MENRDFIEQHFILKENQAKARGDTDQERRFPGFSPSISVTKQLSRMQKGAQRTPAYWGLRMQEGAD
jgi:hypothetical protein